MAWKFSRNNESQTDPFNAPDPEMPGGEPWHETFDADEEDTESAHREERERRREQERRKEQKRRAKRTRNLSDSSDTSLFRDTARRGSTAAARSDRHTWHQQRDTRRTATSRDETARVARHTIDAETTHKKKRRLLTYIMMLIVIVITVNIIGPLLYSCTAIFVDHDEGDSSSSSYSYSYVSPDDNLSGYDPNVYGQVSADLDAMAQDETIRTLDSMIAGDDYYLDIAEQQIDDLLDLYYGYTAEDLGIDSRALAAELLGRITYTFDTSYCYGEATDDEYLMDCSTYFDLEIPDTSSIISAINENLPDDLSLYTLNAPLSEAEQAEVATALEAALDDPSIDSREWYLLMEYQGTADLDGENCALEFDQDAWDESVESFM